ncbi:hypothetical protein IW261DRAFT_1368572 [Armillaria novae-zelandiae]|uniref:F-box domain-containing protein n=1 Tax=Armillaria novae-zelandiae TaxID=153914 RepID=A0AA39UEB3_9AGAR|nr:hypothetical protein IW261DRAFT_1368572 [Armillaria novae-zelandiae]
MPKISAWAACTGCTCPNHHLPSYSFSPIPRISDNPDWTRLTHTNDLPLPSQENTLSAIISSHKQYLHRLDLEKSCLHSLLLDLKKQLKEKINILDQERRHVSEAIHECQGIISPVRRLPPELLCQIFLGTIERAQATVDMYAQLQVIKSVGYSPLSISSVSMKWRSIALSFPQLWSSINILLRVRDDGSIDDLSSKPYRLYFDRSQGYPLSISIYDFTATMMVDLPAYLTTVLSSSSMRIQELALHLSGYLFAEISSMQLSLPVLETLTLHSTVGEDLDEYDTICLFASTPSLTSLKFIDVVAPYFNFELPWSQVKRYRSIHCDDSVQDIARPHWHLKALRELQQVEECILRLGEPSLESQFEGDIFPLVCPRLRTLGLSSPITGGGEAHSTFQQIADRLSLPSLTTLKVSCFQKDDEPSRTFPSICHLLNRSKPPITTLQFDNGLILTEDLLNLFRATHTLEDVRIVTHDVFTSEVLEELTVDHTPSNSGDVVLPRLRHFVMEGGRLKQEQFVRMIQSRWNIGQSSRVERLRTLKLSCEKQSVDALKRVVFGGLEVCIREGFSVEIGSILLAKDVDWQAPLMHIFFEYK